MKKPPAVAGGGTVPRKGGKELGDQPNLPEVEAIRKAAYVRM
jgi:hypothetical protein